jgi:hypothetical protein
MRTLFFDHSGPLVQVNAIQDGKRVLHIADLNPEFKANWVLTRWELFSFGCKCLWAAVRHA